MFPINIFQAFMDDMEKRQPGFKAKMREERMMKQLEDEEKRKLLLEKYGSVGAVLAPCEKEKTLIEACKSLMEQDENGFWFEKNKSKITTHPPTDAFKEAVTQAIPLPDTMKDAWAEQKYWFERFYERILFNDYYQEAPGPHIEARQYVLNGLLETLPSKDVYDILARIDNFCNLIDLDVGLDSEEELAIMHRIRSDIVSIFNA
jgi:hypothetical protein